MCPVWTDRCAARAARTRLAARGKCGPIDGSTTKLGPVLGCCPSLAGRAEGIQTWGTALVQVFRCGTPLGDARGTLAARRPIATRAAIAAVAARPAVQAVAASVAAELIAARAALELVSA